MPETPMIPDETKRLIGWGEQRWTEGKRSRPDFMPRLALYAYWGLHYVTYDTKHKHLKRASIRRSSPNAPVRLFSNIIGDVVDRSIGKVTKHLPTPEGRPGTFNDEDVDAALVATKSLAHEWNRLRLETKVPELYTWVAPAGWSYLQITWNAKTGKSVGQVSDGEDADGNPIKTTLYEGNIDTDIVPFFELTFSGNSLEDAAWAIRETAMTPEEVYNISGVKLGGEDNSGVYALSDSIVESQNFKRDDRRMPDKISVKQLWIPPGKSRDHPKGLVMTWAGAGVPLDGGIKPWPYEKIRRVPFVQANWLPPQGTPFGRTPVHDCLNLNQDFNDALSRQATLRRVIVPKILSATGAIDAQKWSSRFEVVEYKEGFGGPPTLQMPDGRWAQQYQQAMAALKLEIWERMGMTQAARGELAGTSPGVTAITQAELQNDVRAMPSMELNRFIREVGWLMLQMIKQFWSEKRLIQTYSQYGNLEVRHFKGADITDEVEVVVKSESGLPRSKSGRAQLFFELANAGAIPIDDMSFFIKLLDLPPSDVMAAEFNRQKAKQEREIAHMIDTLETAQVNPLSDDHAQHASVIVDYMQEIDWERLTEGQQEAITEHLMGHLALAAAQMQGQAEQAPEQAAPGGVDQMSAAGPADMLPGAPGEVPHSVPGATELAMVGGHAGQPGPVPGVDEDLLLSSLGR